MPEGADPSQSSYEQPHQEYSASPKTDAIVDTELPEPEPQQVWADADKVEKIGE